MLSENFMLENLMQEQFLSKCLQNTLMNQRWNWNRTFGVPLHPWMKHCGTFQKAPLKLVGQIHAKERWGHWGGEEEDLREGSWIAVGGTEWNVAADNLIRNPSGCWNIYFYAAYYVGKITFPFNLLTSCANNDLRETFFFVFVKLQLEGQNGERRRQGDPNVKQQEFLGPHWTSSSEEISVHLQRGDRKPF